MRNTLGLFWGVRLCVFFFFLIKVYLVYSVNFCFIAELLSYTYSFFSIIVYHRILKILCYTAGPCCLSILYIIVCISLSKTPILSTIPLPLCVCCSAAQSCLCDLMDCRTPGFPVLHHLLSFTISRSLLKLMSIEFLMPSNHLILCCPFLLLPEIFPSIRVFSSESALCIR